MRVLQIVALVTPHNGYGGPLTVALNQCQALSALGHDVTLLSTHSGYGTAPHLEGTDAVLFPARNVAPRIGFAGLTSPALLRWVSRHVAHFDVVHVHMARDLLTLPAALIAMSKGVKTVLQTHGMIDESQRALSKPLDAVATRRALRSASTVFYLTESERASLSAVAGETIKVRKLINGVPVSSIGRSAPNLVATADNALEVLFLARLQARKRPGDFVAAAAMLLSEFPDVTFSLVGPDEGEGPNVERAIGDLAPNGRITWQGPIAREETLARMAQAAVYVLPSVDEPFPMSVLEALSAGLPVIVTNSCGLADEIDSGGVGIVVSNGVDDLADAIRRLLADSALRLKMGERAKALAEQKFSMAAVAETLASAYGATNG